MKNVKIRLSTIADVRDFVNIVNRTDADIDLISGRYIVDAKSIMGIFSLDLMQPIELSVQTENEAVITPLLESLKPFIVE